MGQSRSHVGRRLRCSAARELNAVVKGVDNNVLAGTSVYTPAAGTALTAGATQPLKVVFTPSAANAGNYTSASKDGPDHG